MRRLLAFLRRDLQVATAYRLNALLLATGGLFTLTLFYFLARAVGQPAALQGRYGGDYYSFTLVGLATATLLRSLQRGFGEAVRAAQNDGSLEPLLAAPLPTVQVVTLMAAGPVAASLVRAGILLFAGTLLFGARLSLNPLGFAVTLILSVVSFGALGLLSAAFVLVFKRGDPFAYALDMASYLFAGVLYPPDVLPPTLHALARLLPATHALHGLRAAALKGAGIPELLSTWGVLLAFSAVLWPLAAFALAAARRHVERTGTLPHS
ncbi:ABC transporter permease [Corallococcus sp. M34]|uniref:ABC transporter permease n=1 Tax=Citreicoccus inhibens TaxID=2849499 RepID=UPI001C216637|nr:ABC transporter permease [Citreicoccus inhibens]MBU8896032.1 ABC transporter permease [Citreicoccus inhibens]